MSRARASSAAPSIHLSNHAYGTAFDINAQWNSLGARPALSQQKGSVRALVPIANELGWYWGGHYESRKDGIHFEWVERANESGLL